VATQPLPQLSAEEYLAIERASPTKHEFFAGHMYDMAGGSLAQAILSVNLSTQLSNRLNSQGCRAASSDLRVRTATDGLYTYPDVTVYCGEPILADDHRDTLLNPRVIIEILSKSTEAHDRGFKFAEYRRIESLRDYVLVSQQEPRIEVFSRAPNGKWVLSEYFGANAECEFPSVNCSIPLSAIYNGVEFEGAQY
jgi:Uma2 family endonuclease